VGLVERAAVVATLEIDHAENALLVAHRHDEPLGAHEAPHGGGQPGLAAGERILLQGLRGGEDELAAFTIVEEERESFGRGDGLDVLEDVAEDLRQVEGRGEGPERRVERRHLAEPAVEVRGHACRGSTAPRSLPGPHGTWCAAGSGGSPREAAPHRPTTTIAP